MKKRQRIDLFRQHFPDLPLPTDLRRIRTGYALLGASEPFLGHQRLRTTIYAIGFAPDGETKQPTTIEDVTSWEDMHRRLPPVRIKLLLIHNACKRVNDGYEYSEWYIKSR